MNEHLINELKQVINVISLLQIRVSKFSEELYFFSQSWAAAKEPVQVEGLIFPEGYSAEHIKRSHLRAALRRLDHEVMFLCVDVYSLYEGVQKKKSLYATILKNQSKSLVKVAPRQLSPDRVIDLGIDGIDGWRQQNEEEKEEHLKKQDKEVLQSRIDLKSQYGPKSHQHIDMDEWVNSLLDPEAIEKLKCYRKRFAHRLDTLDNLKGELNISTPTEIEDRIDTVYNILSAYQSRFQKLLGYLASIYYEGWKGMEYISLSQIQTQENYNLQLRKPKDK